MILHQIEYNPHTICQHFHALDSIDYFLREVLAQEIPDVTLTPELYIAFHLESDISFKSTENAPLLKLFSMSRNVGKCLGQGDLRFHFLEKALTILYEYLVYLFRHLFHALDDIPSRGLDNVLGLGGAYSLQLYFALLLDPV